MIFRDRTAFALRLLGGLLIFQMVACAGRRQQKRVSEKLVLSVDSQNLLRHVTWNQEERQVHRYTELQPIGTFTLKADSFRGQASVVRIYHQEAAASLEGDSVVAQTRRQVHVLEQRNERQRDVTTLRIWMWVFFIALAIALVVFVGRRVFLRH